MVLEMGGIQRLVELSRNDRERNYSDGVLIASLVSFTSDFLPLPLIVISAFPYSIRFIRFD